VLWLLPALRAVTSSSLLDGERRPGEWSTVVPSHRRRPGLDGLTGVVVVVVGLALVAGLAAGCSKSSQPKAASGPPPPDGAVPAPSVPGFDQVAFRVQSAFAVPTKKRCALYAYTTAQQDQGLMHRHDLAGYAGMIFKFAQPSTEQFYMKDTLIPLSIAWFDVSGLFVSATDMVPCPTANGCPLYPAAAPYTVAIEVPAGGLTQLGIGAGSTISVGGAC